MAFELVAIGASWGGLNALREVLGALPGDFAGAVVVAQHRSRRSDDTLLAALLGQSTALTIRDAHDKDPLKPGTVLLAPPDYHLLVDSGCVGLSCDEPVVYSRPSIDVLFESAAGVYAERLIAVVLTGSNSDGASGLATVHRRGGLAVVQDPATSERPEMPQAAIRAVPLAQVMPLEQIGPWLTKIVSPAAQRAKA